MGNPLFNRLVDFLMPPQMLDAPHPLENEAAEFERRIARGAEDGLPGAPDRDEGGHGDMRQSPSAPRGGRKGG